MMIDWCAALLLKKATLFHSDSGLFFGAVGEIAGITESWDDV